MNDNTNRFKAAIAMLCAEYDYTMSKPKMTLWMAKLSKYDSSQIEAAIDTLLETRVSAYFPRLPEIIHAIDGDPASIARSRFNNVLEAAKQNTPESWAALEFRSQTTPKTLSRKSGSIAFSFSLYHI